MKAIVGVDGLYPFANGKLSRYQYSA